MKIKSIKILLMLLCYSGSCYCVTLAHVTVLLWLMLLCYCFRCGHGEVWVSPLQQQCQAGAAAEAATVTTQQLHLTSSQ